MRNAAGEFDYLDPALNVAPRSGMVFPCSDERSLARGSNSFWTSSRNLNITRARRCGFVDAQAGWAACALAIACSTSECFAKDRGREESLFHRREARVKPVVHCDNVASRRYTIVEIVADDALGLLFRISHTIAINGCEIDFVLIATEGRQGDRRVSHHQGRRQADPRGSARAHRAPATPAGGTNEADEGHHPTQQGRRRERRARASSTSPG